MSFPENAEPFDVGALSATLGLAVLKNKKSQLTGGYAATLLGERSGVTIDVDIKQLPEFHVESNPFRTKGFELAKSYIAYFNMTTKIRVGYKYGGGPKFELLREGTFRSWLKRFGYQDIEVGDTSLDFALTIKGEPEDDIRDLVLANRAALSSYVSGKRGALPTTDGRHLKGSWKSLSGEETMDDVCKLVDLLVGFATTDIVGMSFLLALPNAEEGKGLDEDVVVRVRAPTLVEFYPTRDAAKARLRARAPVEGLASKGPMPCSDRGSIERYFGVQGLPLGLLADAELHVDNAGIWLTWQGIVEDAEVLADAARLLVLLSSPSGASAYR
jgi:hypothetical protein